MFHAGRLQPNVVLSQQLIVGMIPRSITTMSGDNEKLEFAKRMNLVADRIGVPPKGKNRQKILGEKFGVSQEAARKWLEGESIPQMSKCIEIAKEAEVGIEWFLTGRGCDAYANTPEAKVYAAMQHMDESTKYQLVKVSNSLAEPEGNGGDPGTPTSKTGTK